MVAMAISTDRLREVLKVLRVAGVTSCELHASGTLKSVTLGPLPTAARPSRLAADGTGPREVLMAFGRSDADAAAVAREEGFES